MYKTYVDGGRPSLPSIIQIKSDHFLNKGHIAFQLINKEYCMNQESHDHNFKNLFLDFPKEALEWLLPQALKDYGKVVSLEFIRQEPKKRKLSDAYLSLDMPILFKFRDRQLIMWLVEFQEDKSKFSIYKLLRYATDLMESYPNILIIPTVLFTDQKHWKKDVLKQITMEWNQRTFLHFEYIFIKLFDFKAEDYYHIQNPVVKVLLSKMQYPAEDRFKMIQRAYQGLFELVSPVLFDKYIDFIDVYAKIGINERKTLCQQFEEHEETVMLAQYIREKGFRQGMEKGVERGLKRGKIEEKESVARKMIKMGFSIEQIVKITGLNSEEIKSQGMKI
ncbi:hypothetical protein GMMP15_850027 [Candidatus Magnetomoraceae bacterium gMMP-15]